jgi:hypothetical protein
MLSFCIAARRPFLHRNTIWSRAATGLIRQRRTAYSSNDQQQRTPNDDDDANRRQSAEQWKPPALVAKPKEAEFASLLGKDFVDPESVFKLPSALMRAVAIMACSQFIVNVRKKKKRKKKKKKKKNSQTVFLTRLRCKGSVWRGDS